MHFDMLTPCADCPFRKANGVNLRPKRAEFIGRGMLDPAGGTFVCHKTAHDLGHKGDEQHCAGALIFAEKQETATQAMRIAERLRIYDRSKLMDPKRAKVHALVCDGLADLIRCATRIDRRSIKKTAP